MPTSTNWIDFRAIRQGVTMKEILARYGVQLRQVHPEVLRGKCPLPSHSSKSAYSFIVQTRKNLWSCHSSSCAGARNGRIGGNVLDFVAAMENCSLRDAAGRIVGWFDNPIRKQPVAPPRVGQPDLAEEGQGSNPALKFALHGIEATHPYLAVRGITAETAAAFGIGFYGHEGIMRGRIVIPIHNDAGELVAYAGRSIDDTEPKYRFPKGFRKSMELFNLHRTAPARCVIVVEGFFDTMNVYQAGYPNVVALMGSTLSELQERKLIGHFDEVLLMLDGDPPGREATEKIAGKLAGKVKLSVASVPDGTQPDQLSAPALRRMLRPEPVRRITNSVGNRPAESPPGETIKNRARQDER